MTLEEAAAKVRRRAAQQELRVLMLQYGLDTTVDALKTVYQQNVYRRSKTSKEVRERMGLLEDTVVKLRRIRRGPALLRMQETA